MENTESGIRFTEALRLMERQEPYKAWTISNRDTFSFYDIFSSFGLKVSADRVDPDSFRAFLDWLDDNMAEWEISGQKLINGPVVYDMDFTLKDSSKNMCFYCESLDFVMGRVIPFVMSWR